MFPTFSDCRMLENQTRGPFHEIWYILAIETFYRTDMCWVEDKGLVGKLRQLGVPNRIIVNSNWIFNEFGQRLQYEFDSNIDFKSTIAILILILIWSIFD